MLPCQNMARAGLFLVPDRQNIVLGSRKRQDGIEMEGAINRSRRRLPLLSSVVPVCQEIELYFSSLTQSQTATQTSCHKTEKCIPFPVPSRGAILSVCRFKMQKAVASRFGSAWFGPMLRAPALITAVNSKEIRNAGQTKNHQYQVATKHFQGTCATLHDARKRCIRFAHLRGRIGVFTVIGIFGTRQSLTVYSQSNCLFRHISVLQATYDTIENTR